MCCITSLVRFVTIGNRKHTEGNLVASGIAVAALITFTLVTSGSTWADGLSTGTYGISAQALTETGQGIPIGQVETYRPGKPGFDNAANSHPNVTPIDVFLRDGAATANAAAAEMATNHSEQVAGVMISTHGIHKGVAPQASLFSSAYLTGGNGVNAFEHALIAMQHISTQTVNIGGLPVKTRALNLSWGKNLRTGDTLNGNSLLTLGTDWLAMQHDVLNIVGGNEGEPRRPLPSDNYNGMTISYTTTDANDVYRKIDPGNTFDEAPVGGRNGVHLAAPGTIANMTTRGGGHAAANGTSFAAPHVTGTVPLLQQFSEGKIAAAAPRWDTDARRHQVMKAVLMNSADKIKDTGNGNLLGMTKTILDQQNKDWFQSEAYTDTFIPVDDQMGAGQLNAKRAKKQFEPGEYDSFGTAIVPLIGWDWGTTLATNDINKYVFDTKLRKDSFISITSAWDREISLSTDANTIGKYDIGDAFTPSGLTDLDLYLLPKGATDISQFIDASRSVIDSIEHIFFKIPATAEYEFWVRQYDQPLGDQQYGLAWWAVAVPEPATLFLVLLAGFFALRRSRRRTAA